MTSKSEVFHLEDVRQLIFEKKASRRWDLMCRVREGMIEKRNDVVTPLRDMEDLIHFADMRNWRETAALLGLYCAFR